MKKPWLIGLIAFGAILIVGIILYNNKVKREQEEARARAAANYGGENEQTKVMDIVNAAGSVWDMFKKKKSEKELEEESRRKEELARLNQNTLPAVKPTPVS